MKTGLFIVFSLACFFIAIHGSAATFLLCDQGRITCKNGNIILRRSHGDTKTLTRTGLDLPDMVLSPDGKTIAFVRRTPHRFIESGLVGCPESPKGDEAHEIWIINIDGTNPKKIVEGKASDNMEEVLTWLSSPVFSADGQKVYFISAAWVVCGAIHCVDLRTLAVTFFVPGSRVEVVTKGKYKGHLIVDQHRYFKSGCSYAESGGTYDWYWLLTPDGKDVAPLCDSEEGDWKIFNRPLEEILGEKLDDFVRFAIKSGNKEDVKKLIAELKPAFSNNAMDLLK